MNTHRLSRLFFRLVTYWCAFMWCVDVCAKEMTGVNEAYEYLVSPSSSYPNDFTKKDLEAIAVFRKYPEEAKALIVANFLAGAHKEERMGKYLNIFTPEQKDEIIQDILKHYPLGSADTPFTGYLAYFGAAKDMERLKSLISHHPDAEAVRSVATLMAESDNAQSHAALLELKDKVPGKWQDSPDVQKLFEKVKSIQSASPASVGGSQTSSVHQPKSAGDQTKLLRMAADSPFAADTPMSPEPRANHVWWHWGLGAALAFLGLLLFYFKHR